MNVRSLLVATGAALALTAAASAQESVDFVSLNGGAPIASEGGRTGALVAGQNPILSYTFANSFLWDGSVTVNGVLRRGASGDFVSENRILITTASNGTSISPDIQAGTQSSYPSTPFTVSRTLGTGVAGVPINPQGQNWSFRFYNSANDSGTVIDAFWDSLTITFNAFVPPTPPACTDLGNVSNASYPAVQTGSLASGQVQWYCFNVAANTVLDMHTFLSQTGGFQTDTELGLYNANGFLVATNDDLSGGILSGAGNFNSGISTGGGSGIDLDGTGPGAVLGSAALGTRVNGFLAAGTYYLALGGFNTTYNTGGFGVTGGTAVGDFSLTLIPTPGAAAVLGLGALAAARRRRA